MLSRLQGSGPSSEQVRRLPPRARSCCLALKGRPAYRRQGTTPAGWVAAKGALGAAVAAVGALGVAGVVGAEGVGLAAAAAMAVAAVAMALVAAEAAWVVADRPGSPLRRPSTGLLLLGRLRS